MADRHAIMQHYRDNYEVCPACGSDDTHHITKHPVHQTVRSKSVFLHEYGCYTCKAEWRRPDTYRNKPRDSHATGEQ